MPPFMTKSHSSSFICNLSYKDNEHHVFELDFGQITEPDQPSFKTAKRLPAKSPVIPVKESDPIQSVLGGPPPTFSRIEMVPRYRGFETEKSRNRARPSGWLGMGYLRLGARASGRPRQALAPSVVAPLRERANRT